MQLQTQKGKEGCIADWYLINLYLLSKRSESQRLIKAVESEPVFLLCLKL